MTKELFSRILTSFVLFLIIYLMFIDNFLLIIFLSIIFIISYHEFYHLIILIKKNLKLNYFNFIFYNILSFFYLFFFTIIVYSSLIRENNEKILIFFILFICILTDMGGMFFGKLIGGKKLTKISPNKTIAGSLGGFILSLLSLLIFLTLASNYSLLNLSILVIITSFFSQIGDLIVSFLKRNAKVKDTGKILPGHGGIFDRIDGLMFVVIVTFIFYKLHFIP